MSNPCNSRLGPTVALAAVLAGCAATSDSSVVGLDPLGNASISAADISVAYLPVPAGVQLSGFSPSVSAGGYIFTQSVPDAPTPTPFVWTSPYTSEAVAMAAEGHIGGLANVHGDVRGNQNGAGYWEHDGSFNWQFVSVKVGAY